MVSVGQAVLEHGADRNTESGTALVERAIADGDLDAVTFGFLFCSRPVATDGFIAGVDAAIQDRGGDWAGCTTAGEISSRGPSEGGAVLLLVAADDIDFSLGVGEDIYAQPTTAGQDAAAAVIADGFDTDADDAVLFTMMAGQTLSHPGVEFDVLRGMLKEVAEVPVVGGSAGDDDRLTTTKQFCNGDVHDDAVVVVGIDSAHPVRIGQEHGLKNRVATGVVNETDGQVIKTISGQPAAEFYADAIGVDVADLKRSISPDLIPSWKTRLTYLYKVMTGQTRLKIQRVFEHALTHSIGVQAAGDQRRIIAPISVTDDNGLVMTTPIPENAAIDILHGDRDEIIDAGRTAFDHVPADSNPLFAVVSDCMCRHYLLDESEREQEIQGLVEQLGCPVAGFYGYGEVGGKGEQYCTFKNQTVSGFVITED